MRPSADVISRDVAKHFYECLTEYHSAVDISRVVAEAFHNSVNKIRCEMPESPLLWAQFIYLGA